MRGSLYERTLWDEFKRETRIRGADGVGACQNIGLDEFRILALFKNEWCLFMNDDKGYSKPSTINADWMSVAKEFGLEHASTSLLLREGVKSMAEEIGALREANKQLRSERTTLSQILEVDRKLSTVTKERDELKDLHRRCCDLVMPGEVDSSDAYLKILRDAKAEVETLKKEYAELQKQALPLIAVNAKWRAALESYSTAKLYHRELLEDPSGQDLLNAIRGAIQSLKHCLQFDHDNDAHKYSTPCRYCQAESALAALKKAMGDV